MIKVILSGQRSDLRFNGGGAQRYARRNLSTGERRRMIVIATSRQGTRLAKRRSMLARCMGNARNSFRYRRLLYRVSLTRIPRLAGRATNFLCYLRERILSRAHTPFGLAPR